MGSLSSVIQRTQYQAGSPALLPEGVNLTGLGDPNTPQDIAQYAGNVANPALSQGSMGMTPQIPVYQQPVAGPDPERQRLEEIARSASLRAIEAEEQAFQARIAGMSEEERAFEQLRRENEQTRSVNNWLNNQLENQAQQTQRQAMLQQEAAKNQWVILTAHQKGLPLENPGVRAALSQAQNPAHMAAIADNLAMLARQSQQMSSQNLVNSGIFAVGGGINPATPQGPKQRSGDLSGLISSRGQISVNLG